MEELIEKELVYKIVGAALAVHNTIGHGLREKTYERALCVELKHLGIPFGSQSSYPIIYRGETIDEYIPDLEIDRKIVIDTKTVDGICDEHRGQIINYLRITKLPVGLILNFKHPKFQWERIVLESSR